MLLNVLINFNLNSLWTLIGIVFGLGIVAILIRCFIYGGIYAVFVFPYTLFLMAKNRYYGNVKRHGRTRVGDSDFSISEDLYNKGKDIGVLVNYPFIDKIERISNFAFYDYAKDKTFKYFNCCPEEKFSLKNSFLAGGFEIESLASDYHKKRVKDGKNCKRDIYFDSLKFFIANDTLYVVAPCIAPHFLYKNPGDEKYLIYKSYDRDLSYKEIKKFYNPYYMLHKGITKKCIDKISRDYYEVLGCKLKVKLVAMFPNSKKRMNKVAKYYSDVINVYGVDGLSKLLERNAKNINKKSHARKFADYQCLKYFESVRYAKDLANYKTYFKDGMRVSRIEGVMGVLKECSLFYPEVITRTVDEIFMKHKIPLKVIYTEEDILRARKLYFNNI